MAYYHGPASNSIKAHKEHVKFLTPYVKEFCKERKVKTLAFSGLSGMINGLPLSLKLGYERIIVRRTKERSHACQPMDCGDNIGDYVIIDDLCDTGKTIERIHKVITKETSVKCRGIILVSEYKNQKMCARIIQRFVDIKEKDILCIDSSTFYEYANKKGINGVQ